jgi:hypothetical protein
VARAIEPEPAFGLDDLPGRVLVGSAVAIHTVFGEDGPKLGAEIDGGVGG